MENRKFKAIFSTAFFALFMVLAAQSATLARPLAKITVEAGEHTRIDTPVSVVLDGINYSPLCLEEIKGSQRLPVSAQVESSDTRRLCWVLTGTTPAGAKRVYELLQGISVDTAAVKVIKDDSFLQLQIGDSEVLRYNHAPVPPPEGASPLYVRSGFIHPLWSPAGEVLTWMHPKDHMHHMGLWMPWTHTKFEGREIDFWNLGKGQGTVRFAEFASTTSGPVFGGFRAIQQHIDLSAPEGEKAALNEELDVRLWNADKSNEYWLLDYVSKQKCASSSPLYLLKHRYSGLGFRATSQWTEDNSNYLTSEGKTRKDGHATRARWCNVFGTTEKGPAGVVFMSHPQNYEHPEPMRIWPEGHVFFNFCPIQKTDWTLLPDKDYVLRYRLCIYSGKMNAEMAERFWQDFTHPPEVTLEKVP
ncbi:MAG: DUF6807 domain-containing protein [Planctomycetota bacterium]|jgi:hypothetical protein